jgi:hypothetical protein
MNMTQTTFASQTAAFQYESPYSAAIRVLCSFANLFLNHRPSDNLWEKAVEALDGDEKCGVDFERSDKLAILKDLFKAVEEKKQACLKGR